MKPQLSIQTLVSEVLSPRITSEGGPLDNTEMTLSDSIKTSLLDALEEEEQVLAHMTEAAYRLSLMFLL